MRTVTGGEAAVLAAAEFKAFVRVTVKDSGGTSRTYNNLSGSDWQIAWSYDETRDQPIASVQVRLWRGDDAANSIAPLMSSSAFAGYIDIGRAITVEAAAIDHQQGSPGAGDWKLMFDGVIDEVDWGGTSEVVITARDNGALLEDTHIEAESSFGSGAGVAVETVIQQVLDANLASPPTLYTPVSPGHVVKTYRQKRESVMSAVRALAQSAEGWDLRYKYDSGTGTYRLTLFEPDRAKSVADVVFGDSLYHGFPQFRIDRTRIKNVIQVFYLDASLVEQSVTVSDATSITKYGRRYESVDAKGLAVRTSTEATDLGNAILLDLKDPTAEAEWELPFYWPAELNDLIEWLANSVHFDTTQKLTVAELRHEITSDRARTRAVCRGRPAGAYLGWLGQGQAPVSVILPRWTESLTKPTATTGRLTLTNVVDPQLRLVSVRFIADGGAIDETDNAPGPYEVDAVPLFHSNVSLVTYQVTYYTQGGQLATDEYTVSFPFSAERLFDQFGGVNLLDAPGFEADAQTGKVYTDEWSVALSGLAPLVAVGDYVSAAILITPDTAGETYRVRLWFEDSFGAQIGGTFTGDLISGAGGGIASRSALHAAAIPANTATLHIGATRISGTGSATITYPIINPGRSAIAWIAGRSGMGGARATTALTSPTAAAPTSLVSSGVAATATVAGLNAQQVSRAQHGVFFETFEVPVDNWLDRLGTNGAESYPSDGQAGGKVYQSAGLRWKVFPSNIPFDPSKLYRLRIRARRTGTTDAGNQVFYAGLEGVAADGTTLVNTVGADDPSSQHYILATAVDASAWTLNAWQIYTGWLKGHGGPNGSGAPGSATSPSVMHASVRYVRPLFIVNYPTHVAGNVMQVDEFAIDVMDEDAINRAYTAITGAGHLQAAVQNSQGAAVANLFAKPNPTDPNDASAVPAGGGKSIPTTTYVDTTGRVHSVRDTDLNEDDTAANLRGLIALNFTIGDW